MDGNPSRPAGVEADEVLRTARSPLLVALAACSLLLASAAAAAPRKLHGNNFFSNCRFSHTAPDDPIVLPRQPGRSHPHTFFGNTTTSAASTLTTLLAGGTTCRPAADKAAYWVPTLYENGREVRPAKAQLYYVLRGYDEMHAFPPGLRIVAGNARPARLQSTSVVYWACGAAGVTARVSTRAPRCGLVTARFHGVAQRCRT